MTASSILTLWKSSLVFFSLLRYALPIQLQLKPTRSSIQAQGISVLPHKYNVYDEPMLHSKPKIKHPVLYRTMYDMSSANHSITSLPMKEKKSSMNGSTYKYNPFTCTDTQSRPQLRSTLSHEA
jgi:hypothetical protein